jgi:hypothetical protein
MMKYLSNSVDWEEVHTVGFVVNGTLYDEMEFISQVYRPISQIIADACGVDKRGGLRSDSGSMDGEEKLLRPNF